MWLNQRHWLTVPKCADWLRSWRETGKFRPAHLCFFKMASYLCPKLWSQHKHTHTNTRSQATSIQLGWPQITFVRQVFRLQQSIPIIFKKLKVMNTKSGFIICLLNLTCYIIRGVINEPPVSRSITVQNTALIKHNRKCQSWITNGFYHHSHTTAINTCPHGTFTALCVPRAEGVNTIGPTCRLICN